MSYTDYVIDVRTGDIFRLTSNIDLSINRHTDCWDFDFMPTKNVRIRNRSLSNAVFVDIDDNLENHKEILKTIKQVLNSQ